MHINRVLGGLFLFSAVGVGVELLLQDHYETWWQRAPLFALGAGTLTGLAILLAPGRGILNVHRIFMLTFIAGGFIGTYLHYQVNEEFELELYPSMKGLELFQKSIKGAIPALAPFAMMHVGLLGLVSTYRFPVDRRS